MVSNAHCEYTSLLEYVYLFFYFILFIIIIFFLYPPSSGIAPCVGTAGTVQTPTLDSALLNSSRSGAVLGRTWVICAKLRKAMLLLL